mmetsp:Transcript_6350/g.7944  ORF Transcript_6350/g.7944 Transcript_6350/m.7944 type:complete len:538 (+) Transcript_6350:264-1877(+)
MNIIPVSRNTTESLACIENINNHIYDYSPSNKEPKYLKRSKSQSTTKLSRQLPRTPSNKYHARNKRRPYSTTPPISLNIPSSPFIHLEFSLSSSGSESSDLESLPDLYEDKDTPFSSPINRNPLTPRDSFFSFTHKNVPVECLLPMRSQISIFEIPEIVYKIIEFADIQNTVVPQESTPIRRKPLSRNHAFLIHGDKYQVNLSLQDHSSQHSNSNGVLFNCLQVNKLFNQVTNELLNQKFFFSDERKLHSYLQTLKVNKLKTKPSLFVFHKLFHAKQDIIELIKHHMDFANLQWLEFYMCPKLLPTPEFLVYGSNIKKIVITGSKVIDDGFLSMVAKKCPNLEILDIRACELISDSGVYQIAKMCRKLTTVNFGRKNKGNLITDSSLCTLIRNNPHLNTVGLAGCHITDKTLWDLAIRCSDNLQRLSLNNCPYLTNQSIPLILHSNFFKNLSVLELRFANQITNFKPIIEFKRRQEFKGISILIEVCETLCLLMREQELEMDKVISQRIFEDISYWANDNDDGDLPYQQFVNGRRLK